MKGNKILPVILAYILAAVLSCTNEKKQIDKTPVTENTPSKSIYFDWINVNWYGGNEKKVINNLKFFKWMHDEYRMPLDIYLLDAGNVDNGPSCNGCEHGLKDAPQYGGTDSEWFKQKYPNGLDSIVSLAKSFGCKIGLWIGPDGYGNTDSSARQRIDMLDQLTKKYDIALFKMDACCSDLKPENEKYFVEAMRKSYANNPELIVLNHRITLSDSARKYTTTFLWQGAETYIDVSSNNNTTSPHHRYTLERGVPPDLKRLTEDHGVCLSSYLDYWEDDLVLQAFNRNLILSPEIYGNPWFLRDGEFPLLARIFNLHKKYNSILVNAMQLPEEQYGKYAVSRGDEATRFLTLRNLSWNSKKFTLSIDESIGIKKADKFEVHQYHPFESSIGNYVYGEKVEIEVLPFRSALIKISSAFDDLGIEGCKYSVIKDIPGQPVEIELLGMSGEETKIKLMGDNSKLTNALLDGKAVGDLDNEGYLSLKFEGTKAKENYHRPLGKLTEGKLPSSAASLLETMYFATDNNCLEARTMQRSGETKIDAVKNAREAFFTDKPFVSLGAWDHFAFDKDSSTSFRVRQYCDGLTPGVFRVKFPSAQLVDEIRLEGIEAGYKPHEAFISSDLFTWIKVEIKQHEGVIQLLNKSTSPVQYLKLNPAPRSVSEILAFNKNQSIEIGQSTASNLFPDTKGVQIKKAWEGRFTINELTKNSTLAVAIEGEYGENGAFALIQIDGKFIGAFDRSPAFPFNNWEHVWFPQKGNYTYYFKIPEEHAQKKISVHVMGLKNVDNINTPEVWLTAYPIPFQKKRLVLKE